MAYADKAELALSDIRSIPVIGDGKEEYLEKELERDAADWGQEGIVHRDLLPDCGLLGEEVGYLGGELDV